MRTGSHLLHHEQGKPHKAETISEILQHNGPSDKGRTLRLENGKQRVSHKRQIEHTTQGEQSLFQSTCGNIISTQQ